MLSRFFKVLWLLCFLWSFGLIAVFFSEATDKLSDVKTHEIMQQDGSIVVFRASSQEEAIKSFKQYTVLQKYYKVKRNLKKMIDQNAPQEHLDLYLSQEGVTAEQLRAAPRLSEFEAIIDINRFNGSHHKDKTAIQTFFDVVKAVFSMEKIVLAFGPLFLLSLATYIINPFRR